MKIILSILGALIGLVLLFWALSAALGYLIGAVILVAIALLVGSLLKMWLNGHARKQAPDISSLRKAERKAEQTLRQMEKTHKERNEP